MDLQKIVETVLRDYPNTRANNDLVWAEVSQILAELYQVTTVEGFLLATLEKKIPSSHTLAATISVVRKAHPELNPTDEQMERKKEVKQQFIEQYRNA